jgi:uncharacterized damage-inducible protein DinB
LSEDDLWHRVNERCNSVGNLLLHLRGNVQQWIVSGVGGEPFSRDRPAEFAERGPLPLGAVWPPLQETASRACAIIGGLPPSHWRQPRRIQGYDVTVFLAVLHVVEHFSFHTGQIVHMTKALRNVDLSLYDAQGRRMDARAPPW